MVSSRRGAISGAFRFRGDADSYERSGSRRARDRDPPTDLGCAGAHRVQAEVTGMPGGWVEAAPVVVNLEDDLVSPSLDTNMRRARRSVLLDVEERFPRNGEQLGFGEPGQREPWPRSLDIDRQRVR